MENPVRPECKYQLEVLFQDCGRFAWTEPSLERGLYGQRAWEAERSSLTAVTYLWSSCFSRPRRTYEAASLAALPALCS